MRNILFITLMILFSATELCLASHWEKQDEWYFLTKDNFTAVSSGMNKFASKYIKYDGVDFWVRAANNRRDYGRLNLEGNNIVSLPIKPGMKIKQVHFLSGGNFGNSYEHDQLLSLYGDNYYYAVITVIFAYMDGVYKMLSVPVFWDWFHLSPVEWSKDGASIKYLGSNPVRKDCSIYHISFANPQPESALKDILVADSWLSDRPFTEVFAVTLKSKDTMEAMPRKDEQFKILVKDAAKEPADQKQEWLFDNNLDGWIAGCSGNWDFEPVWLADSYARKGLVSIPACNWAGDKFSWLEKKVALPGREKIEMQFLRHSGQYSNFAKQWSDSLLKVIVKGNFGQEVVYEKLYSGEWSLEKVDLSKYKGQCVVIRFENHGAGNIQLSQSTSASCDAEDVLIDDICLK